ncbi:FHA domain-containing protein [bacterium]|nr:FHA domain-containing protein [bacterium]
MDDSTRILEAGTQDYPLDAGIAAAAEPCPHCSVTINAGLMFCPSCGYQRGTWAATATAPGAVASIPAAERGPALFELVDASGNSYAIPAGETVLGRGEVDIQIGDGYLSRRHALFTASAGKLSVSDLGSANGSFVGDMKLDRDAPHDLPDGTQLRLGRTDFTVRAMDFEPAAEASETLVSPVQEDNSDVATDSPIPESITDTDTSEAAEAGRQNSGWVITNEQHGSIAIPLGETTLGRSAAKSDLQLSGDGYVSGLHGMLSASADGLVYSDLGSTNGSMVNDEAVAANEEVSLSDGDKLCLGQTEFNVSFSAAPDAIEGNPDEPGVIA